VREGKAYPIVTKTDYEEVNRMLSLVKSKLAKSPTQELWSSAS
jgi:hypothetical protein